MPVRPELYLVVARRLAGGVWQRTPQRVTTKKHAAERMEGWRRHHREAGWDVSKHADVYYAVKGDEERSIALHEYDAEVRIQRHGECVWREEATGPVFTKLPRPKVKVERPKVHRKGRKPVGV